MEDTQHRTIIYAALAAFAGILFSSCSTGSAEPTSPDPDFDLPPVSQLDSLRPASAVQQIDVDVTDPLSSEFTTVAAPALMFDGTAGHSWAIYRMGPIEGDYLDATATGSGPLWLLAADYGPGHWRLMTQLDGGTATIDLTELVEWLSPVGYTYLAVVCPVGETGQLDSLSQEYWTSTVWEFGSLSTDDSLTISWSSGMGDNYDIYRSTFSGDPAPYLVGNVLDSDGPRTEFSESVNEHTDGTWLPDEDDNGSPGDSTDDFPTVAPGIDYYYTVVPIDDLTGPGDPSPEVVGSIVWAARRSIRRDLPSSADGLVVFADQLLPNSMSPAQIQFCAENMAGTQKIFRWQVDEFRTHNPDFVVLGYHLGLGAGNIGNVDGFDWDNDADWPYVDAHESWFLHKGDSTQPGGRVLQQDWNWFGTDPVSDWQNYLGNNMLQMLGEDHFDGWFIDSNSELWNTDPAQWWPDGTTMFGFWTPRVHSCLQKITQIAADHPLQPYVIPNAGAYITTVSDIKYYGTNWACDGIMIENYGRWDNDNGFGETDWRLECDRILDHQANGLATILQCGIWIPDADDRQFQLGTYYLVKGDNTYINWLGDDGLDTVFNDIPQWYPEWDFDIGANLGPNPLSMDQLEHQGLYRRDYANGFVVVNPTDTLENYSLGLGGVEYMTPSGGGNIDGAGTKLGSLSWTPQLGSIDIPANSARIFRSL